MPKYLSLVLVALFFNCKENKETEKKDSVTESKIDTLTTLVETIPEEILDTIKYDDYHFPIDSLLTIKLLTESTFHEDEVEVTTIKKEWFGIFKNKNTYKIAKTRIFANRVYDVVLDENESDKSGWEIKSTSKDTSLILIEALPYLTERKIESYDLPQYIYPNDTIIFKYLNKEYKLFATGEKTKESEKSQWYYVWNYKLYLSTVNDGVEKIDLLVANGRFDDNMVQIIFAGDIDGDGKLDLLIDTSNHYNASSPTLYLSKPADEGHIIKPVAVHTSVGC